MKLSACIVVYNGYDEALKAAQTVLHCTRRYPVTLYLVDNASPDGSGKRLPAAAKDGTLRTAPGQIDKRVRQVEKKIDVLKTFVYTSDEVVQQEIALYKVTRSRSVERLVRQHTVRILEIDDDYFVVEKTGHKAETKELFRLLQPYGVQQFVRSGIIAIIKSRRELLNEYLEELERSRRQTNSNHF